jgi:hypothetical protein
MTFTTECSNQINNTEFRSGLTLNNLTIAPGVRFSIGSAINTLPQLKHVDKTIYTAKNKTTPIDIYPNPSKKEDVIHIKSEHTIQEIKLFSTQGTLLQTYKTQEYYHILNLNSFPRGTYLLHVITLNNIEKIKIILE